ncbi:MAG: cytidylate kinase-like family protein [Caldilineales bacterium]|nr:cytidylate kinase-like family protein [Caldilineales bacterium]MDW8319024.1 cytidylate kinase-like family protein [Anaerolineae bacterium]
MAVITVSRQFASGGDEIAARVCELLGYSLFDKTLMAAVAAEAGLTDTEIVDFSETSHRGRSFLDRLLGRRITVAEVRSWREDVRGVRTPTVQRLTDEQAIGMVRATLEAAYRRGDVVIVGRGGQAALKGRPDVLHVRIEAPLEHRIQRCMDELDLPQVEAELLIEERDRAALDYVQRYYGINPADPQHYHLVINTGLLDLETAADVIVLAVQQMRPVPPPNVTVLPRPTLVPA